MITLRTKPYKPQAQPLEPQWSAPYEQKKALKPSTKYKKHPEYEILSMVWLIKLGGGVNLGLTRGSGDLVRALLGILLLTEEILQLTQIDRRWLAHVLGALLRMVIDHQNIIQNSMYFVKDVLNSDNVNKLQHKYKPVFEKLLHKHLNSEFVFFLECF